MNVVERELPAPASRREPRGPHRPADAGGPPAAPRGPQSQAAAAGRSCPILARYRWQALAALVALVVAAVTTLVVPLAVRRMIDFGFSRDSASLIDSYFTVLIAVAAVLALASAARFYLVTTLGERIVADLRSDVFAHLTSLSAAFFDQAKTGETDLAAHRRHHADQGRGRLRGVGGAAQPRAVPRRDRHDGGDQPAPLRLRAGRHPGDRAAALRLRPRGTRALARRAGHARRGLRLCLGVDWRHARAAGLHQRDAGAAAVSRRRSSAPSTPRVASTRARAILTAIAIFLVFAASSSCCGSARRTCWPDASRRAGSRSSCSMRCSRPAGLASCRRSGASSRRPPARPSGCSRFSTCSRRSLRRRTRRRCPSRARRDRLRRCPLRLSDAAGDRRCSTAFASRCGAAKRSRSSALRAPARARSSI